MRNLMLTAATAVLVALPAWAGGPTPANPDAVQYIVSPVAGETVTSPVKVVFGLAGMGVAPAGIEKEMTGHHHLLLDRAPFGEENPEELSTSIPADENNIHYGGGQTETMLDLEPGSHTLQLVLGDQNHVPHATPVMSEVITITVE